VEGWSSDLSTVNPIVGAVPHKLVGGLFEDADVATGY